MTLRTKTQAGKQNNNPVKASRKEAKKELHPVSAALAKVEAQEPAAKNIRRVVEIRPAATEASAKVVTTVNGVSCQTVITRSPVVPAQPLHPSDRPKPAAGSSVIKLGLDVDKRRITVATQHDYSTIKPAATFTPDELVAWVKARVQEGHVVWTVYEACGFGYTLYWRLREAGAHALVIAPIKLDSQRRRKTDGLDARQLCGRLTRYLDGQRHELPVIRVPSVAEQQRRETVRQRLFWRSVVHRLASHGRALRLEHEHEGLEGQWWTKHHWKEWAPQITPFVREILETLRPQLEYAQNQVKALTKQLEERVQTPLPAGLGALTMASFDGEICDANRFGNRKQVGSFIGCCPSVYSSGTTMHQGSIDRHGNKHMRALLVEAVWRLVRYQPGWWAYQRLLKRMTLSVALRKKTVVALARQLAIDLWRVRTGRTTWEELGFVVK